MKAKDEKAIESIRLLLEMANVEQKRRPELSETYVRHAWKIKMRHAVRLPADLKRRFCKKCFTLWVPGLTCRVRLKEEKLIFTCFRCGRVIRVPYKK